MLLEATATTISSLILKYKYKCQEVRIKKEKSHYSANNLKVSISYKILFRFRMEQGSVKATLCSKKERNTKKGLGTQKLVTEKEG